ncbi:MAG: ROK family protein [Polyangiaceae bacterium]
MRRLVLSLTLAERIPILAPAASHASPVIGLRKPASMQRNHFAMAQRTLRTLSVDIGGTGIKMMVLDAEGHPLTERTRELTPRPSTPAKVLAVFAKMLDRHRPFERVSVGFPGVVRHGVVRTAPNLGTKSWEGHAFETEVAELAGCPTRVINDADLQGYGVVRGDGVEMVLTLGTGVGSALFVNGHLLPNLELGHHPFKKGQTYEERVSEKELVRIGRKRWSTRVGEMLEQLAPIFNYDVLYLGGGNLKKLELTLPENVVRFENVQGLRGGIRLWGDR